MLPLPDGQLYLRPEIIEFGWGHPDAALLPVEAIGAAATHALADAGQAALAYGAEQGPGRLIEQLRRFLAAREANPPDPAQLMITGGVSQALDLLCTLLTKPGDIVLVEAPTYHLSLRIMRDHGLDLIPVPTDAQGLRVDALEGLLELLQAHGRQPRLLYSVSTFSNPSGATLPAERRAALSAIARRAGFYVIEDDVYRELWYDTPPPAPLFAMGPPGPVIRLGSFSKILAPGLRLGWMQAPAEIVRRCVGGGLLDSGGGVNHFTAHVVAALFELGLIEPHLEHLRQAYQQRRNSLLAALARNLPAGCTWMPPLGGYFIWLRLPEGFNSAALLPQAEAAGVAYLPGDRFFTGDEGHTYLRLSFSLLPIAELAEGARRLGAILRQA
jgi:DNA-binding transcriptional MocR family regulator